MGTLGLALREVLHRRASAAQSVLAAALAVSLVLGGLSIFRAQSAARAALVAEKRSQAAALGQDLEDAMRLITKRMGFNVLITPRGQSLDDPFSPSYAAKMMPEEYADRLAGAGVLTVSHILPALEQRVEWPERAGRTIFVVGIKGQVPVPGVAGEKKPILEPVTPGGAVLGESIARTEGLEAGSVFRLLGEELKALRVEPRRGDKRDRTIWVELRLLQRIFQKPGQINAIWALECSCALADVGRVREEIGRILPDVDVEEQGEKALARAEARKKAAETAARALADEEAALQGSLRLESQFRVLFLPLLVVAAGVWIGLLAWGNVRERRDEVGVLQALGRRPANIALLFLARAAVLGALGAAAGAAIGTGLGELGAKVLGVQGQLSAGWHVELSLSALAACPILCSVACWLPAIGASRQDPAAILRDS